MRSPATATQDDVVMAHRAFDLFTLAEREQVLAEFARLRYSPLRDRFYEAVYVVIQAKALARGQADTR